MPGAGRLTRRTASTVACMDQGNSSNASKTEFGALPADADIDALAAQLHAAFNIATSLGAWLGGITIAAGRGTDRRT
jgi:predicted MFS family arabinose efflux permease